LQKYLLNIYICANNKLFMITEIKKTDYVQSLEKGLRVLMAFSSERQVMTLTEVAKVTNLSRAAARRFLLTYAHLGYVKTDGKFFELTPKVLNLGYNYLSSLDIKEIAKPFLIDLSKAVNETCSVVTVDGNDVVILVRQQVSRIMTVSIGVGSRLPTHVTAVGRVILAMNESLQDQLLDNFDYKQYTINTITNKDRLKAELVRVKEQGYSLIDQELEAGVRAIAVPIYSKGGKVKYAIHISSNTHRVSKEDLIDKFLPHLQEAANGISEALGKQ